MEREYIVSLKEGVNYDEFWDDMEHTCTKDGCVPERIVDIVNERPGSTRSCHYALSDTEADALKNDPRVYSVEIPPDQRTDVEIGFRAVQNSDFSKTTSNSGSFINWGLRRCIDTTNGYGSGTTITGPYNYVLDGTGVDVVIQDSGLETNHPEFRDDNGVTRVQQINWYTASGINGIQSANFYRDFDGHGTHCGGIAAGRTYGWAKNARIFSMKLAGLEGAGDSGTGISIADTFDVIKLWHRNKPVDPKTGFRRPTIVNMSWGYSTTYTLPTSMVYRGVTRTGTDIDTTAKRWAFGLVPVETSPGVFRANVRIGSVDVDIEELVAEGVHVCIAAGNNFHKIDVPGGLDYNNAYNVNSFYHRGSSPLAAGAINVGNIDREINGGGLEQKNTSSETGPGVDVYAPGTNIMSATSNTNKFASQPYYLDGSWRQVNITGTSMACPQIVGLGALYLQMNPGLTAAQLKEYICNTSGQSGRIFSTGLDNDYTNLRSILGGPNRFGYFPFAKNVGFTFGPK